LEGDKWQVFAFGLGGETDLGLGLYPENGNRLNSRASRAFSKPSKARSPTCDPLRQGINDAMPDDVAARLNARAARRAALQEV
jgi:hypothetical protein